MAQSNCSSQMLFYFNDSIRKRANYKHMTSVHLCCGSVHSSSLAQLMFEAQLCLLNGPKSLNYSDFSATMQLEMEHLHLHSNRQER